MPGARRFTIVTKKLIAAAIEGNPDLLLYQYIVRLSPGIQVMLVPSDNPFLLTLPSLDSGGTTYIPH